MSELPSGIYVLGFGGHARSVGDIAIAMGIGAMVFVDGNARPGENFCGFEVVAALPEHPAPGWRLFPAAGDNIRRLQQVTEARLPFATLIAPSAYIGAGSRIGAATLIAAGVHVGPLATIGEGVIINTRAIVEHESEVGPFSHVSVNAVIAGRSRIGARVMVGAGAVIVDSVSICDDVTIGAGATVVRDITEPGTYVGAPARRIR
jgi:UDP-N-acetylbacillosamine N-acetyltransferase